MPHAHDERARERGERGSGRPRPSRRLTMTLGTALLAGSILAAPLVGALPSAVARADEPAAAATASVPAASASVAPATATAPASTSVSPPVVPSPTAVATPAPTVAPMLTPPSVPTVEPEAADFASDTYGDPWDYSNTLDLNTDFAGPGTVVSGGALHVPLVPGDEVTMVSSIGGSIPYGRDGGAMSIDTTKYSTLSVQMDQPLSGHIGAIYWWTCRALTTACGGGQVFSIVPGSHRYDFDLNAGSTLLGKTPWAAGKVVHFRFDPVVLAPGSGNTGTSASIDWMRLHAPADASHPHADLPPGTYGSLRIEANPEPVVDTPDPTQGADLATAQRGKPWVFTSAANGTGVVTADTRVSGYGPSGLTGTNAPPLINDPQVYLPVSAFSGSTYHYLTVDMTYDGGFGLADDVGGGKMARLIWGVKGTATPQIGNDLLTYSGVNAQQISIDLTAGNPLDEDAIAPKAGWAGQTITAVRFDPNEDRGAAVWHLKAVHLRATPAATESTTVTFHDAAWEAGTTATLRVGTGAASSYTTVATNVPVTKGENAIPFALGSRPAGTYHVQVVLRHPNAVTAAASSTAPIAMSHLPDRNPRGSLDAASGTTSGVTVRGWAFDPDASGSTNVRIYDGARSLATVATSVARPDVRTVYPSAPATTGWSTTVKLSAGTHTLCAYGLNVGAGTANTTLGCRTVTVAVDTSHDPRGRLDALVGGTGTVRATGWGYDPDAAAMTVRFYEGTRSLGSVTTSLPRADVRKVYPSAPTTSGYTAKMRLARGTHTICAYGINVGTGTTNTTLGCRAVTVG